jgi:hypothetical protein
MKGILIIVLVVCAIVGLLFTLRSSRNVGMPSEDVMKRAQRRAREQAAEEKDS